MQVSSGKEKRERKKEEAPFLLSPIPSPLFLHSPPPPPLLTQANSLKAYYSGTPPHGHLVNTANFFLAQWWSYQRGSTVVGGGLGFT